MSDYIRFYDIPGFNGPGEFNWSQESRSYSAKLRALCRHLMEDRRPDTPTFCPRCTETSIFDHFLTYRPGFAGAHGYKCWLCGLPHWPEQPSPSLQQLEEIANQRALDAMQRGEAAPRGGVRGEAWRFQEHAAVKGGQQGGPGGNGRGTGKVFGNSSNSSPRKTKPSKEEPSTSEECPQRTVTIVLWAENDLEPLEVPVVVGAARRVRLADHGWLMACQGEPWDLFEVWSDRYGGWKIVTEPGTPVDVENDADRFLVRLGSVQRCSYLGVHVSMVEEARMRSDLDPDLVDNLMQVAREHMKKRDHIADSVWVVVWSHDGDPPTGFRLPVAPAGTVNLLKVDEAYDFASGETLEIWQDGQSTWSEPDNLTRVRVCPGAPSLLVRVKGTRRLSLFGLELTQLHVGKARAAVEAAPRSRSPALEFVEGSSGSQPRRKSVSKRARSPSVEIIERPASARRSTRRRERSPSVEFLD